MSGHTHIHTYIHTYTHRTTTVTLAAHARRGLIIIDIIQETSSRKLVVYSFEFGRRRAVP